MTGPASPPRGQGPRRRPTPWAPVVVLLLATALRLPGLHRVPPGFQFDEAYNALDAARVAEGDRPLFLPANGGREPVATYLHAPLQALLGEEAAPWPLRLASAWLGIATVAVTYRTIGLLFADRTVGLLAAAFLATSLWHVHFSRFGIRAVLAPLWTAAAIAAWWGALHHRHRRRRLTLAAAAGGLAAAAVYSHPSGRLLPAILAGHLAWRRWTRRGTVPGDAEVLATSALVASLLLAPLGRLFLAQPALFTGHPSDVSLAAVAAADYGGSMARALAANAARVAGMFFVAGDPSTFHNLPGLPALDPVVALLAVLGAGAALAAVFGHRDESRGRFAARRRHREAAALLWLWLAIMLVPTLLSDRAPNFSRAIAALPAIVALPALGGRWLRDRVSPRGRRGAAAVLGLAVALSGTWTFWHYFVAFPKLDQVYYSYDVDKLDAYAALAARAATADVYLHPLWANHATIAFRNRRGNVAALDGSATLVIRNRDRASEVAFPAEEEEAVAAATAFLGPAARRDDIVDRRGAPLLVAFRVPAAAWGDLVPPTDAPLEPTDWRGDVFGASIQLLGATVAPPRPGRTMAVTLWWRSLSAVTANLTVFVHLVGADGAPVGQEDREPGKASWRTSQWRPPDIVVDRYEPLLSRAARGPVTVEVGWYDNATGDRLPVGQGTAVRLGPYSEP